MLVRNQDDFSFFDEVRIQGDNLIINIYYLGVNVSNLYQPTCIEFMKQWDAIKQEAIK
jgi:hypothetical protein